MRASAYALDVHNELHGQLHELRRTGVRADIYVVGDAGTGTIYAKRLEHAARERSRHAVAARKELAETFKALQEFASSGALGPNLASIAAGRHPARASAQWHKLKRRLRATMTASARMPTAFPAGSRQQASLDDVVAQLRADAGPFTPNWRVRYVRAAAEADQAISLLSRALVEADVVAAPSLGVESADGDYTLMDDPSTSFGAQFYWSFRRKCFG